MCLCGKPMSCVDGLCFGNFHGVTSYHPTNDYFSWTLSKVSRHCMLHVIACWRSRLDQGGSVVLAVSQSLDQIARMGLSRNAVYRHEHLNIWMKGTWWWTSGYPWFLRGLMIFRELCSIFRPSLVLNMSHLMTISTGNTIVLWQRCRTRGFLVADGFHAGCWSKDLPSRGSRGVCQESLPYDIPYAPCMEYVSTFTFKITQMYVNIPAP